MAVFRDVNRNIAIVLFNSHQHIVHRLGINLAAPGIFRRVRIDVGLEPALDGIAFDRLDPGSDIIRIIVGFPGFVRFDQRAGVAVLTEEIDRVMFNDFQIFFLDKRQVDAAFL